MNINVRLNQILRDPIFTNDISLTERDIFFDRFCVEILPKINDQIKSFSIESVSLERILLASNYPNLCQLDIFIITEEAELYLNGKMLNID